DVDPDAGEEGQVRLAEPDGPTLRAVTADEPGAAQSPIDDAELRVVHPLPGQHADGYGQGEGDDDERPNELLPTEVLTGEEGRARAQHALVDRCDDPVHNTSTE